MTRFVLIAQCVALDHETSVYTVCLNMLYVLVRIQLNLLYYFRYTNMWQRTCWTTRADSRSFKLYTIFLLFCRDASQELFSWPNIQPQRLVCQVGHTSFGLCWWYNGLCLNWSSILYQPKQRASKCNVHGFLWSIYITWM